MTQLLTAPYSYFADANGLPLNGGLIGTYAAGTTTPKATYTDSTGITPLSNPVVLDSAGRAAIWLNGNYKIVVMDSLGNVIRTVDNVSSSTATGDMTKSVYDPANIQEQLVGLTAVQTLTNKTIIVTPPTKQIFTTTGSGTYTTPAGCLRINVKMVGGGAGGNGSGTSPGSGGNGVATVFGSITTSTPRGAFTGFDWAVLGGIGQNGNGGTANSYGGNGGGTYMGPGAPGPNPGPVAGNVGTPNTGAGGSGASCGATTASGSGGAGGTYGEKTISSPSATYAYTVGAGGTGGTTGTSGAGGGAGGSGIIIVEEFYI